MLEHRGIHARTRQEAGNECIVDVFIEPAGFLILENRLALNHFDGLRGRGGHPKLSRFLKDRDALPSGGTEDLVDLRGNLDGATKHHGIRHKNVLVGAAKFDAGHLLAEESPS